MTFAEESDQAAAATPEFQSAIPVSNGKIAMWLFLSTEMMFFVALIASYFVLRMGAADWPTQETTHVKPLIGIVNTVILLLSGVAISVAVRSMQKENPSAAKRWVIIAMVLGTAFLGVKSYEYYTKISHGLYPRGERSLVYDSANVQYLGGLSKEIKTQIGQFEGRVDEEDQQELLLRIQSGMINWTQQKVGSSNDPLMQRMALKTLAYQISPTGDGQSFKKYLQDEQKELATESEKLSSQITDAEAQLKTAQDELRSLQEADDKDRDKISEATKRATELTTLVSLTKKQSRPIADRLKAFEEFGDLPTGINEHHSLSLPIVIPGGNTWVNTYYLLTGFHALHIVAGIVLLLITLCLRLDRSRLPLMENIKLYWYFVDFVWLLILPLLYFV